MSAPLELVLVANARIPSQRAQSVQLLHSSAAFARAGARTTLLVAERRVHPELPPGADLFDYYAVARGARPAIERAPCTDWVDRLPVALQYAPARVQELSFSKHAAKLVLERHPGATVLAREIEVARHLALARHPRLFLELHRVPAGRLRRRWLALAAAGARGIVAISGGVRADLVESGIEPERIRVEHDALDPERFRGAPDREAARAELRIASDAALAVYTGGLLAWKGADLLPAVARRMPHVQFLVAGGMDRDVAQLRALGAGATNLRIDGFQAPARVALYLAAADVALVPNRGQPAISARYTSPLKVFEAMALGVPLVASDLPSLRELLEHERDALLVAPDDAAALAAGIDRVLTDVPLRTRMRERLLARAGEHTWDARARRILDWMGQRTEAG